MRLNSAETTLLILRVGEIAKDSAAAFFPDFVVAGKWFQSKAICFVFKRADEVVFTSSLTQDGTGPQLTEASLIGTVFSAGMIC